MKIIYMWQQLLPAVLFVFTSCVENVDLDHLRPQPKLVLNTVALVNSPLTASLSRTWFYTDNHPNVSIPDARVELYVNDAFREQLTWKEGDADYNTKGYYASAYYPAVGDRLRLVAKAEGFKDVSAETVLPAPAQLLKSSLSVKSDTVRQGSYYYISTIQTCRITLKDDGARDDYYLIRFEFANPQKEEDGNWEYHWHSTTVDYSSEPIFDKELTALDKVMGYDWLSGYNGRVFSDELINGKEYTLNFTTESYTSTSSLQETPDTSNPEETPDTNPAPPELFRVILYSLSEDYYKYLKVIQTKDDANITNSLVNIGLSEPIRVYSNISGGLGICGSCCKDSLTIEYPKKR